MLLSTQISNVLSGIDTNIQAAEAASWQYFFRAVRRRRSSSLNATTTYHIIIREYMHCNDGTRLPASVMLRAIMWVPVLQCANPCSASAPTVQPAPSSIWIPYAYTHQPSCVGPWNMSRDGLPTSRPAALAAFSAARAFMIMSAILLAWRCIFTSPIIINDAR